MKKLILQVAIAAASVITFATIVLANGGPGG